MAVPHIVTYTERGERLERRFEHVERVGESPHGVVLLNGEGQSIAFIPMSLAPVVVAMDNDKPVSLLTKPAPVLHFPVPGGTKLGSA